MVSMEMVAMVWIAVAVLGCEATTPVIPALSSEIRLENGGLCDTKEVYHQDVEETKCRLVVVHGRNFVNSKDLTCHFSRLIEECMNPNEGCSVVKYRGYPEQFVDYRGDGGHLSDSRAEFINSTTIICKTDNIEPSFLTINYEMYIKDPLDPTALYMPYSSLCQDCSEVNATCVSTVSQMRKYCRKNGKCIEEDVLHPEYKCNICGTAKNGTKVWHPVISIKCGFSVLPTWSIVLLVMAAIAAIVTIAFLVRTCLSEVRARKSNCNAEENTTAPEAQRSQDDRSALVGESA